MYSQYTCTITITTNRWKVAASENSEACEYQQIFIYFLERRAKGKGSDKMLQKVGRCGCDN